jgi:phosphoserine phosphatase
MPLEQAAAHSWAGTTPEAFDAQVRDFFDNIKHPKFEVGYTKLVYQPMLELINLLKENDFRVFVCSGGGRDFMRVISEKTWGIYKEDVIGSAAEYVYKDGKIIRTNAMLGGLALGPGKPEHIFARTGRLPIFACGNGDVDIEMLETAKFALLVNHDDDDREYVYTQGAENSLVRAKELGWTIVSMKNDWNKVF